MNNDRELLQQVFTTLDEIHRGNMTPMAEEAWNKAIEAIRARLAQPEPEPVAWTVGGLITDFSRDFSAYKTKTYTRPLYTAPPQREWQGLTDDEIYDSYSEPCSDSEMVAFAREIETKLKEKNS